MPLLLGLTASPAAPRLPVADASAAALIGALLTRPAPENHTAVVTALARDPPFALWAVCRCYLLGGGERRTIADIAAWLLDAALVALGGGDEAILSPFDDASLQERSAAMAAAAVSVAELAAEDAGPQNAAEAYLLALLHGAPQWLSLTGGAVRGDDWLPAWLSCELDRLHHSHDAAACGIAASVARAIARQQCGTQTHASQSDQHADWQAPVAGTGAWLPALIDKLARLQALETGFQQALEAEKLSALVELAAGAGHEINNPLAVISGRAQMLIRDERDPERRHALAAINAQALRVHEMIADMMLFARPPAPKLAPVDVTEIVRRVLESLQARAAESQIELTSDLPQQPLLIDADPTQLTVALKALCENSLEAIGRQGRIEIMVRTAELVPGLVPGPRPLAPSSIELIVRDNGPGIPPDVRRHIFDPFYSGRLAGRGIGFGLSKCWRIVTSHGGTIEVESTPGAGAVFTIQLPARKPDFID